jgi:hypothetical protein
MAAPGSVAAKYPWKKRRVLVISGLPDIELKREFERAASINDLNEEFIFTTNYKEAEFVLFDFDYPPPGWGRNLTLIDRWKDEWPAIDPSIPIPFFFLTRDSGKEKISDECKFRQQDIRDNMQAIGIDVQTANACEMVQHLRWFRCMLPHRRQPPQDTRDAITASAVASVKTGN